MGEFTDAKIAPKFPKIGERRLPKERVAGNYNITFVPGNHVRTPDQEESIVIAIGKGDSSVHYWNPQVEAVTSKIQPKIVTLDTISTYATPQPFDVHDWSWLFGMPSRINESGSFFLVRGDQLGLDAINNGFFDQGSDQASIAIKLWNDMNNDADEGDKAIQRAEEKAFLFSILGVAIGSGIGITAARKVGGSRRPITASRRAILLGAAAMGTVAAVGAGYKAFDTAYNTEDRLVGEAISAVDPQKLASIIAEYDKRFPDAGSQWVAARNAQLFLKTLGAYNRLGLDASTPSVIGAGDGHIAGMSKIMESEEYAGEVLRNYIQQHVFPIIDAYYTDSTGARHNATASQVKQNLVDFVSLTGIEEIRDPDPDEFKSDPIQAISKINKPLVIYHDARIQTLLAPLVA